ncbi:MAG: GTP-binding protein [Candidatus Dojkabacteria bacterium]|jgi:translation initiation factor IF-2|nr:GTP-binding protein [Candidatus Dojkabacteria bacterium]MDD2270188.1 GTP-binding protein [Candidatus Dojkabacteria bacterium]
MTKGNKGKIECRRIPIVTILGHVDHGKTTILDRIREADVQSHEVGGITQKISVFTIKTDLKKDSRITFIDTPGHEAFDLMRLRGGNIADITLLVVAANDGVQPQTKESINIIKNSTTKPIVVINKTDLPDIDIKKIKRDLANEGIQLDDMGGDIPSVEVSGKTGKGIPELLEMISLVIEMEGFQEREPLIEKVLARAIVLESIKEKTRGNISTVVVTQGCFSKGEFIGYFINDQPHVEKVKALISEDDASIAEFDVGSGGKIIGLSNLLDLGSEIYILEENDKKILANMIAPKEVEETKEVVEIEEEGEIDPGLASFFDTEEEKEQEEIKEFCIILKSSSEGSLEALKGCLTRLDIQGAELRIIDLGVGDISIKDIERAQIAKAVVLGFEVSIQKGVPDLAKRKKVLVRTYDIIYKLVEEMSDALNLLAMPEESEEEIGKAVIKAIFTLTNGQTVLGNRVQEGKLKRDCKVYIVRDDEILTEARIKSLKINKNDVKEATKGMDSGIILDTKVDAQEGDEIYCYKVVR